MSWDDLKAELSDLFEEAAEVEPRALAEDADLKDDQAARWLAYRDHRDPEEWRAEKRACYRINRINRRADARARYHRCKDLSGPRKVKDPKDPEERKAEGRARYRLNRLRFRIKALARYHRGKDLSGLRGGPQPKLSKDEVLTIQAIFRTDPCATAKDVAEHFNVSSVTIYRILNKKRIAK